MSAPSPDISTKTEAAAIPTRTPFEQQRLAEELAIIELDKGRDTLRAIEATLLECAQTPKDKYLAESGVLRLKTQRELYIESIASILEYNITQTKGRKPNLYDVLRYWYNNSYTGSRPVNSKIDRVDTTNQELDTTFLIFSAQQVATSTTIFPGDEYPPSDQYLTRVISALTGSEATIPTVQSPFRSYLISS